MIRQVRAFLSCFFLAAAIASISILSACTGATPCTTDADCTTAGQKCLAGGTCGTPSTTGPCTDNAACGEGKVCDEGACYPDCTAAGFAGCDVGNKCDQTLKRCTCSTDDCKEPNAANSGCHPQSNSCQVRCTDDTQCTTAGTKCMGPDGNKYCIDPAGKECRADVHCATGKKCDTATNKCVDGQCTDDASCGEGKRCDTGTGACVAKCTSNDQCIDDPDKSICKTDTGVCVGCTADADCISPKTCDTATNACTEPAGCTDTATCNGTDKKTYCDDNDKAAGCKTAEKTCTADNAVTKENNDSWDGSAGLIWGVQANRVTADKCWSVKKDGGQEVPCTDGGGECDAISAKCFTKTWLNPPEKVCGTANTNGMVEVSFNFYMPDGLDTTFTKGVVTHSSDGFPTDQVSITSGDENGGAAKFGICIDGGGSYQFFVRNKNGGFSNSGCYSVEAR